MPVFGFIEISCGRKQRARQSGVLRRGLSCARICLHQGLSFSQTDLRSACPSYARHSIYNSIAVFAVQCGAGVQLAACGNAQGRLWPQNSLTACASSFADDNTMGKPSKSKARAKARQKKNKTVVAQPAPSQLMKTAVWQPGIDPVDEGDALDYDPTAYDCLVAFSIDWPCLRLVIRC